MFGLCIFVGWIGRLVGLRGSVGLLIGLLAVGWQVDGLGVWLVGAVCWLHRGLVVWLVVWLAG